MSELNPLYDSMKVSADSMSAASVEMKRMMTASDTTDVSIAGYGATPSFAKQIKARSDAVNAMFNAGLYGYYLLDSFQAGVPLPNNQITLRNQVLRDTRTGEYYRWDGDLPKRVPAGSTPESTGGTVSPAKPTGLWVGIGSASVQGDVLRLNTFASAAFGRRNMPPLRRDFGWVSSQVEIIPNRLILNPSPTLQSVDYTVPTTPGKDVVFRIHVTGVKASQDFNGTQQAATGVHCVVGACTGLLREGFAQRTGAMTYDGHILEVTMDSSRNTTGFASIGLRMAANSVESVQIFDMYAMQDGVLIGRLPLFRLPPKSIWGGNRIAASVTGLGSDFGINMLVTTDSVFDCNDFLFAHSSGSTTSVLALRWALELNLKWAEVFTQFNKWRFTGSLPHYSYRRTTPLRFTRDTIVYGEPGTVIMGGRELTTGTWEQINIASGGYVFKAPYDYDTNPDAAIRAGTRQPFVGVRVPSAKTNSMRSYRLIAVANRDLVDVTAFSFWYDHANKTMYFNTGSRNDSAYAYVCEVDIILNASASVYVAGCSFIAAKTDNVRAMPASYSTALYAGFYQCSAGVSAGGSGAFTANYIDAEYVQCIADSHLNDGFNFHYEGTTIMVGCTTRCNGDDGISHHEACVGYVLDCDIRYNYAAASVPAFGAKVWHYRCNAIPPIDISTKAYAGRYAAISGQGQNTIAYYDQCFIEGRDVISEYYHCSSQEAGTTVRMVISNPSVGGTAIPLYRTVNAGATVELSLADPVV